MYGNVTDLTVNSNIAGMDNRFVTTFAASTLRFDVAQDTAGPDDNSSSDAVSLVNPNRGVFGFRLDEHIYSSYDNIALAFEDRLKLTRDFALIGGIRIEEFVRRATRHHPDGSLDTGRGYPVSVSFRPVTGRVGYTWEALPGLMFYSQYATAADPAGANSFRLDARVPFVLTSTRTYETGLKHLFWDKRAEWTFSAFDTERRNVFIPETGRRYVVAGKIATKGVEWAGAVNPFGGLKLWGNVAYVESRFVNFDFVDGNGVSQSYSGKTPANVPAIVANAGGGYRFATAWPVEIGASARYVGDRFNFQDNLLVMNGYVIADAYVFVDIPKSAFNTVNETRLAFRVRTLTDRQYAAWGDPTYNDQIILGSPRSYEVAASFKW
jgi:iron complex outermembrane receptor protein